jgi:hypothetical protein
VLPKKQEITTELLKSINLGCFTIQFF